MEKGDRYRIIIIISYVLLIICSVVLIASLWNNLSLNPNVQAGNGLYFLVFAILILASMIFILHLIEENRVFSQEPEKEFSHVPEDKPVAESSPSVPAPFEVDIDLLAGNIVPRIDLKESIRDHAEQILLNLAKHFEIVQGIVYLKNTGTQEFEAICTYAYASEKDPAPFKTGDGLPGQAAKNKTIMHLTSIPEGYLKIQSGLGTSSPRNLIFIPLLLNKDTFGIIELASFHPLDKETEWTLRNLARIIGNSLVAKIKSAQKK